MKEAHINLQVGDISKYVILPGDPGRVDKVGKYLENSREIAYNREFKTLVGYYKDIMITVTSTGIGGPSTNIALEELHNIGGKYFIRIGSAGAVNSKLKLGDLVVATGAVREDGLSKMYVGSEYPAVADFDLLSSIMEILRESKYEYHYGIVRSHDSFYIDNEDEIMDYWNKKGVLASDMETSTLLTLGSLKGFKAASILNNVVEYKAEVKEGIASYVEAESRRSLGEEREILVALEALYRISRK